MQTPRLANTGAVAARNNKLRQTAFTMAKQRFVPLQRPRIKEQWFQQGRSFRTKWAQRVENGQSALRSNMEKLIGVTGTRVTSRLVKAGWVFFMYLALGDKIKDMFDIAVYGPDCGRLLTVLVAMFVPKWADSLVHQTENVEVEALGGRGHETFIKEELRNLEEKMSGYVTGLADKIKLLESDDSVKALITTLRQIKHAEQEGSSDDPSDESSFKKEAARIKATLHKALVGTLETAIAVDINQNPDELGSFEEYQTLYEQKVHEYLEHPQRQGVNGFLDNMQARAKASRTVAVALGADLFNLYLGPNGDICSEEYRAQEMAGPEASDDQQGPSSAPFLDTPQKIGAFLMQTFMPEE